MSPKIPLTTPITSSMNLSGPNIDVGIVMAQTSCNWSIPIISVTLIPQNLTNKQMHVSEGPGSTPQISSRANPQSKLPHNFLLNLGQNPVVSQEAFEQSKQPNLNIPSGSQVHVGHEKLDMAPKGNTVQSQESIEDCDELYASSPMVHKENVTGHHHPYAFKPRKAHSSSLREEIVDDEYEKVSPNNIKTNDEPSRDYFTFHEEGTQSNSEFTHPQMTITQSMLEQSKTRKQRNQDFKAHNVAKNEIQKEKQGWLKAELPENFPGMRAAVHTHFLFLLKVRDNDFY
ncbi:hypothetical protein O181_003576 [Austropuccinia psidii MF-1]|uniref:Uncharacterized protein n=1 Tax=Austropuccinia psidii MF-1 TaxID=1389203 RepID=A0A9Q3BDZ7_9BASI|nr:hypothetical protein [Austropuccinia psidii MF-1]